MVQLRAITILTTCGLLLTGITSKGLCQNVWRSDAISFDGPVSCGGESWPAWLSPDHRNAVIPQFASQSDSGVFRGQNTADSDSFSSQFGLSWGVAFRRFRLHIFGGSGIQTRAHTVPDLIDLDPRAVGVDDQDRNGGTEEPKMRGSRRLPAESSLWVAARIDLDTAPSKIDARFVEEVVIIKGPYTAKRGPDFSHLVIELLDAQRSETGLVSSGRTGVQYATNGEPWYGWQIYGVAAENWGARFDYSHGTSNDYVTGTGAGIPSSYVSRNMHLALGVDISEDSRFDFHYLRVDQTGVELPGQAFDTDFLVTDGFEFEWTLSDQPYFDQFEFEAWYNRTRLEGNAQRAGKRLVFPGYGTTTPSPMFFVGNTDADAASAGFRAATTWGCDCSHITLGADLRQIKTELNEISSGRRGAFIWNDANSPIPKSESYNTGLFVENVETPTERLRLTVGARLDWTSSDVIDDPAKLASVGALSASIDNPMPPLSFADVVGTAELSQNFSLAAAYVTGEYVINSNWSAGAGVGYAERSPSLTELYVAESFMFLLQNGLNIVTGDPRLDRERLLQCDLGVAYESDRFRFGINGFHGWVHDYITFENLDSGRIGGGRQVSLKYVNTELATLVGGEIISEFDATPWMTLFGTLAYVDGRDRTRDGDFATRQATLVANMGVPSVRVPGVPRGSEGSEFAALSPSAQEPLPGISPLESRIGMRLHEPCCEPNWALEFTARFVNGQDRVATSLVEVPTPGFAVFDLRGYWQATERLLLIGGAENLADATYREHSDLRNNGGLQIFQPGINFYFGSELTY